jgi:hypothetical protein
MGNPATSGYFSAQWLNVIGSTLINRNMIKLLVSSSSSSGHEVRPINNLFQPYYSIHPVVCLTLVQVFVFQKVGSQIVILGI